CSDRWAVRPDRGKGASGGIGVSAAPGGGGPPRIAVWRAPPAATRGLLGTRAAGSAPFSGKVRKSPPGFPTGDTQAASSKRQNRQQKYADDLGTRACRTLQFWANILIVTIAPCRSSVTLVGSTVRTMLPSG